MSPAETPQSVTSYDTLKGPFSEVKRKFALLILLFAEAGAPAAS